MAETTWKAADWHVAIPDWVANGKIPSKRQLRAFREFCEASGYGDVDEGFHVHAALCECVNAWQEATDEERAGANTAESFRALRMAYRMGELKRQREEAERRRQVREAHQAELEAAIDEPGFVLLAGESTAIITSGTLRECRAALPQVTGYRRDPWSGLGCWVIMRDGRVVESGTFSSIMYWTQAR